MSGNRVNRSHKTNNIVYLKHDYSGLRTVSRQGILWPCFAYKVLLPTKVNKIMNIFEETILKLAELGIVDTGKVAKETCLNPKIVSFIQNRLHQIDHVDSRNRLSEEGSKQLEYLRTQLEEATRLISCTVFLDTINDVLLPFTHFGRIEYEMLKDAYPISRDGYRNISFFPGTAGSGHMIKARQILYTENTKARTIEVEELIASLRKYRRLTEQYSVFRKEKGFDIERIPRVSAITIDQQPELVYLYCEAFVQEGKPEIYVTNGFGIGYSNRFKSFLLTRNYRWLLNLKEGAVEHTLNEKQSRQKYGDDYSLDGSLREAVKEANWNMKVIKRNKKDNIAKTDSENKSILDAKNNLMKEIYGIIENVFRQVIFEYPARHWRKVFISSSYKYGSELVVMFAEELGLEVTRENSQILRVIPGKVRAIEEGIYEMRALLSLIIAGAHENKGHPFRRLIELMHTKKEATFTENDILTTDDNILTSISKLRVYRNSAMHGEKTEGILDVECKKYHSFMRDIVKAMLPGKEVNWDISKTNTKAFINANQMRLVARIAIDKYFGLPVVVSMPSELRQGLISLSLKEQINHYDNHVAGDYVNTLASIFQIAFQNASLDYPYTGNKKGDFKSMALERLEAVLSKASTDMLNPSSAMLTISARQVKNAVTKGNTTLGGSFLAFCLLLPENTLIQLFKQIPEIEQVVSCVHELRGHGTNSREYPQRMELIELRNKTYAIVKKILES